MRTYMESCQHKEGGHMQSKAMEMLDKDLSFFQILKL